MPLHVPMNIIVGNWLSDFLGFKTEKSSASLAIASASISQPRNHAGADMKRGECKELTRNDSSGSQFEKCVERRQKISRIEARIGMREKAVVRLSFTEGH